MKKLFVILLIFVIGINLVACEIETSPPVYAGAGGYELTTGLLKEVTGYDNLYYDTTTNIVYIIFSENSTGSLYRGYGYMSAYYAPNGLPYLYDVDNHVLVEINS